jgi:outer membrane lipoprotein carrier protein
MTKSVAMLAAAALAIQVSQPLARADSLDAILARMDRAAKDFKSVTAKIRRSEYTAVVKELSAEESGELRIRRAKNGVTAILDFTHPNPYTILIKDKKVNIYRPKAKLVEVYDFAKYNSVVDQFLLLAFGTSGVDLRKNYEVKRGGAETVESVPATRLELFPTSDEVKKLITKIELWIPEGQSNAIREKINEPSGNYNLADYSNIKLNVPLPDSAFDLKLPKDVKTVRPQH